jgi:predicted enzyme related to lactoylglutathione lyase
VIENQPQGEDGGVESRLAQPGSVTYIQIPAPDQRRSADFYAKAFGWTIRGSVEHLSFDDASGFVSGAFLTGRAVSREPGILPYIYVDAIDETIERVKANGGEIVTPRHDEGNLWVATFRDPGGNVIGVWQQCTVRPLR